MSQPRHSTRTPAKSTGRHRAASRPRYGRIATVAVAASVTLVAVAGGLGVIPTGDAPAVVSADLGVDKGASAPQDKATAGDADPGNASSEPGGAPSSEPPAELAVEPAAGTLVEPSAADAVKAAAKAAKADETLPAKSGAGRRIVFSEGRQRAWLIDNEGKVQRTYLVSGSLTDNLKPGTYAVFSRSRNAIGIDDSGTMEYFVRFTHGTAGAAIGFHTIPVDEGKPVQTRAQLGTPRSHGCIRQDRADAIALWDFAPVGTKVVVTA